ncbi:MAG: ABC transporter permease [Dongiaceae bacterium]
MLRLESRGQRSPLWSWASPLLALALTLATAAVLFAILGQDPGTALYTFFVEPLLADNGLPELLVKASPLVLIATALALGFRANVWNIGAEGQYTLGALAGGGVALWFFDSDSPLLLPAMMLAGIAGGMAWAAIPALLRTRFNASEILTSLMLTYVAQQLLLYLVTGPWKDPEGYGFPQSRLFSAAATLPILVPETRLHLGVVITLAVVLVAWGLLARTLVGFQLKVVGQAPRAARYAGFSEKAIIWLSCCSAAARPGWPASSRWPASRAADAADLAGLRLHRHHRRLPRPAPPGRHPVRRAGAGALLSRRRERPGGARPAQRGDRHLPGHPALLPARLRHPDPLPAAAAPPAPRGAAVPA